MEWDSDVIRFRRCLEHSFEESLRAAIPHEEIEPASVPEALDLLESRFSDTLLDSWSRGSSSLLGINEVDPLLLIS